MKQENILIEINKINSKIAALEGAVRDSVDALEENIEQDVPEGDNKDFMWDKMMALRGVIRILEDLQYELNYLWDNITEDEKEKPFDVNLN